MERFPSYLYKPSSKPLEAAQWRTISIIKYVKLGDFHALTISCFAKLFLLSSDEIYKMVAMARVCIVKFLKYI